MQRYIDFPARRLCPGSGAELDRYLRDQTPTATDRLKKSDQDIASKRRCIIWYGSDCERRIFGVCSCCPVLIVVHPSVNNLSWICLFQQRERCLCKVRLPFPSAP